MNLNSNIIGIDGCRGGWLFTTINKNKVISISLFSKMSDAIEVLKGAKSVYIDMPIGLVDKKDEVREIDLQIRKKLGHPFSSSVFTVPCKQSVYAKDFEAATQINRDVLGKGISIQAWNICAKIKELDIFLNQNTLLKPMFYETHPELCFKQMNGKSLVYKKKTQEGFEERLIILERLDKSIRNVFHQSRQQFLKKHVANDDMLDSLVLAYSSFLI